LSESGAARVATITRRSSGVFIVGEMV